MPEHVFCPHCTKRLRVPDHLLGRTVKCPGCANSFLAAVGGAPPADEPRPRDEAAFTERPARRSAETDADDEPQRDQADWDEEDDDYEPDRPRRRRRRRRRSRRRSAAGSAALG